MTWRLTRKPLRSEVTRHEDRLCLLRRAASAIRSIRRSVPTSKIRLPVACGVSCPDAAGLRKFHPCRHSPVSAETTTIGDERCSPAGILFVALAEISGAHRLQACSPCVQVPSRSSTAVPRRRTQPAGQSESPFHHVVIAVRSAYTRLSTIGDLAFPVAAARVWNCLPQHVTSAPSLPTFRSRLTSSAAAIQLSSPRSDFFTPDVPVPVTVTVAVTVTCRTGYGLGWAVGIVCYMGVQRC